MLRSSRRVMQLGWVWYSRWKLRSPSRMKELDGRARGAMRSASVELKSDLGPGGSLVELLQRLWSLRC